MWWPIKKITWPWKNLGCFGVEMKSGFYFDIYRNPNWEMFILNPNRKPGSWSCKYCRRRLECITWGGCIQPRTWVSLSLWRSKYARENLKRVHVRG